MSRRSRRRRIHPVQPPPAPRPTRRARRALSIVLVNLLVLLGLLLIAEAGARVFAPRDLRAVFNDPQVFIRKRPFVEAHPQRGFALVPGYDQGMYRIDSAGFRGPELPGNLGDHDIVLCLGESSTFGWGVAEAESYPPQLQDVLDAHGYGRSPLVINAGVPSYTSPQVLAYLRELLGRYAPRAVVVSVLWNDALFACIPNWMPDYLAAQQPAPWRQILLRHSGLYRAFVIAAPGETPTGPVRNERALEYYADTLAAMIRTCGNAGVPLLLVRPSVDPAHLPADGMKVWRSTIPSSDFLALVDRFVARMDAVAAAHAIPVVRHRLCRASAAQSRFFLDPVHLNGDGNRLLAEDIGAALVRATTAAQAAASGTTFHGASVTPFVLHVLGGSTALGDPYAPRADLGRIASLFLDGTYAGRPLVVENHGGKGKPAAGVIEDARAIAARHPDPGTAAAFLYLGNNEFLGFDRRHDLRQSERQLFDVPSVSDAEKSRVLARYRSSISTIVDVLVQAGVRVVALSAAVNLRDWEPNRSVLADPAHAEAVRTLLQAGEQKLAGGDPREARAAFEKILGLEPGFALAHKRAGDCALLLGDREAARQAFLRAVDHDGNPYRELSAQHAILREVCAAYGVPVIDSQVVLDGASEVGITGFDLMWDNCHPTLEGYRLLARACAAFLAGGASQGQGLRDLDRAAVEAALGIDAAFRAHVLHERGQYCYGAATLCFDRRPRLARARTYLQQAASLLPGDPDVVCSLAVLSALEGDTARSLDLWRRADRMDSVVTRSRISNRYVEQILHRSGLDDLQARLRTP